MMRLIWRELQQLKQHKWDLCMVTVVPLLVILLFSTMFIHGKAEHMPIAIIDQDHSQLSHNIEKYLRLNSTLDVALISDQTQVVETALNKTQIWGYIYIPEGAEQRLSRAEDAQINIFYNQSFYSIGSSISTAMSSSTIQAALDFLSQDHLGNMIPYANFPTPHLKISPLYNPNMSYEFFLEPFVIPAVLHLLLCCVVAFSIGQDLKKDFHYCQNSKQVIYSIFAKILLYVTIFCAWTWGWLFWMILIRGWFVAGHLWLLLLGQFALYCAYALVTAVVVMFTQNLAKTFGFIAMYGGSSLSFSGISLPINNAPLFTKFWSNIIPFTPYAKLQTEQWVIGSDANISMIALFILLLHLFIYLVLILLKTQKMYQYKNMVTSPLLDNRGEQ
ncbi:MAG: ABC transporter permease [Acinetobacter sp.]